MEQFPKRLHENPPPKSVGELSSQKTSTSPSNSSNPLIPSIRDSGSSKEISATKNTLMKKRHPVQVLEKIENRKFYPFELNRAMAAKNIVIVSKPPQLNSSFDSMAQVSSDPSILRSSQILRDELQRQKSEMVKTSTSLNNSQQMNSNSLSTSNSISSSDQLHSTQNAVVQSNSINSNASNESNNPPLQSNESNLAGYIFLCNLETEKEAYQLRLLGAPKKELSNVKRLKEGCFLFLYNLQTKLLNGVFQATCNGGFSLEPRAFKNCYLAQIRFKYFLSCQSLKEKNFKSSILSNYYESNKFHSALDENQVNALLKLFLQHKISEIPLNQFPYPLQMQICTPKKFEGMIHPSRQITAVTQIRSNSKSPEIPDSEPSSHLPNVASK